VEIKELFKVEIERFGIEAELDAVCGRVKKERKFVLAFWF